MSNIEEKINKIKVKKVSDDEKNFIWLNIAQNKNYYKESLNLLSIFNIKKTMIGALIALLILGGGGGVVAASNTAVPGDALYGVDLAYEKVKLNLALGAEKKDDLRIKFAEERVSEAKTKLNSQESANVRDVDLSLASVTEIEADVFLNETTVKIEADNKHYGFITDKKTKTEVVEEISKKYNLSESKVESMIDFEVEDRNSRTEDKNFLNSSNSLDIKTKKEKRDFEISLSALAELSNDDDLSSESRARLNLAIDEIRTILESNPNSEIKIKNDDFRLEIKENGQIKFESKDDDHDDDRNDDKSDDSNRGLNIGIGAGINLSSDQRESEDEVFCRGEWRDQEDCDDSSSGKNKDDDKKDDDHEDDD